MTTTAKQTRSRYGTSDFTRNEAIFEKEVQPRMRELLAMNDVDTSKMGFGEEYNKHWKRQNTLIEELEKYAYEARSMTGRMVYFPMADSHAVYMVVKVNKTTCRLQWLDVGDGWEDARLGASGSLPIAFVHDEICWRDNINKAFSKKKTA